MTVMKREGHRDQIDTIVEVKAPLVERGGNGRKCYVA